jgi:hypothetical protein
MSGIEEQPRQWWMFYPIKGLDITDEEHDLLNPMFGDCTLISRNHIRQVVPLLRLNERMAPGHDHERDITYMLENATLRDEFQSFVAVRRTGIPPNASPRDLPPFLQSAKLRAYEVSALLSLVMLARNRSGTTIGLVEQLHSQTRSLVMLELQDGGFRFQIGGGRSLSLRSPRDTIALSRQRLQEMLREDPFACLSNVLLPQSPTLPRSLHRAISQSAIRLSDSLHTVTESSRLLGSVTSIEILITEQGDSYETLHRRMIALLGTDAVGAFDAETVLQARHAYVHRGNEPANFQVSLNAIGLAISCLLRSAEAASSFVTKPHFLDYLDLVHTADRVASHAEEGTALVSTQAFLKHNRSKYELPFLAMVMDAGVTESEEG